jgi:hypothetical protein
MVMARDSVRRSVIPALRRAFTALVVTAALLALALPAHAVADPDAKLGDATGWRSSTFMVGDSITYQGLHQLRSRGASWEVTTHPGRYVCTLKRFLKDRLANPQPLRKVVIALGTNACEGWGKPEYRSALDLLPASTAVVFVTTYRDPKRWRNTRAYRERAGVQYWYSRWMKELAAERPHTCVADWRTQAASHMGWLSDGTHLKPSIGRIQWSRIVFSAVRRCA